MKNMELCLCILQATHFKIWIKEQTWFKNFFAWVHSRCFVVVLVLLSMAWIPIINSFSNSQLFVYIQSISSFLTPPVAATFLLAIFWHRTTEQVILINCATYYFYLNLYFLVAIKGQKRFCTFLKSQGRDSPQFSLQEVFSVEEGIKKQSFYPFWILA